MNTAEVETTDLNITKRGIEAPLSLLRVLPNFNVREDTKPDEEMLKSVKAHGVLRPLHVRNDPENTEGYVIVDGERRFNAATELGLETVPVIPEGEMDESDALVLSLVANEGHKDLSPKETANAFSRLKDAGVEDGEIARVMGYEVRKVKETLKVLKHGTEELKDAVKASDKKERIPPRAAARAADLPPDVQKAVVKEMKGKNARQGLEVVRREEKKLKTGPKRGRKVSDYVLAPGAKKLCRLLEAAVTAFLKEEPNNRRASAHMEVISVLKGKIQITDLYPDAEITIKDGPAKGKKEQKMPKTKAKTTKKKAGKAKAAKPKTKGLKKVKRKVAKKKAATSESEAA